MMSRKLVVQHDDVQRGKMGIVKNLMILDQIPHNDSDFFTVPLPLL